MDDRDQKSDPVEDLEVPEMESAKVKGGLVGDWNNDGTDTVGIAETGDGKLLGNLLRGPRK